MEETDDEDTDDKVIDIVNNKLGVSLDINDLQRSHRLGAKKKPSEKRETRQSKKIYRPIIFKLLNYRKRMEIFGVKKKLKNSGIGITENLTKLRLELYNAAIDLVGRGNAWTSGGNVFAIINHAKTHIPNIEFLRNV